MGPMKMFVLFLVILLSHVVSNEGAGGVIDFTSENNDEDGDKKPTGASPLAAQVDAAGKAVDVVNKGVDVLTKIDNVLTGKLNAHYEAVAKRPKNLIGPGDLQGIAANLTKGQTVTFESLPGFDGVDEFQPAGWKVELTHEKAKKERNAGKQRPGVYPMGVGNLLMSGCFGTGYQPGDPCYKNLRFLSRCDEQIDAAYFIGAGFDITQSYSSDSRKRSVIQRVCSKKKHFLGRLIPDNMNAYGMYDYSIRTHTFQSSEKYREYLTRKSGVANTRGVFQKSSSEFQNTGSAGSSGFLSDYGGAHSYGGASSSSSGVKISTSLQNQMSKQGLQSSTSFLAVLEADLKLYEMTLDHSSPDELSMAFMKDFMNLPTSYFLIGADKKLQDFVLRYGTHYVKSAKYGGKLNIFKKSKVNSRQTKNEFASAAQREFSAMMSTLKSSFSQSPAKGNAYGTGFQHGSTSSSSSGSRRERFETSKTSSNSGTQLNTKSEFIETTVRALGGDPNIAAAIMDFYTPAFKDRFIKWLQSIPDWAKPYDMTFGRIPELLDVSAESLFKVGTPGGGCFEKNLKKENGTHYFMQTKTNKDINNNAVTTSEKVICKYLDRTTFMEDFKSRRLALERAITIFIAEGPFATSSFDIQGGDRGCQTQTIDYMTQQTTRQSQSWPNWNDMKRKSFKVLFQLPHDLPMLKRDVEFEVGYFNDRWFTKIPGNRFTIDNSYPELQGFPDTNRVCVAGLYLLYDQSNGFFTFDTEYYKGQTTSWANITNPMGNSFIARAEVLNVMKHLEQGAVGEVPCNIKWSNAHRIDPQEETSCIHFSAASAGNIFVVFASIPKERTTWYYLQLSPTGIAFYRGVTVTKVENKKSSGTLGDEALFERFFVCLTQRKNEDTKIMYGKAPAKKETGQIHATHTYSLSSNEGISFYTFAAGEHQIVIDGVRLVTKMEHVL